MRARPGSARRTPSCRRCCRRSSSSRCRCRRRGCRCRPSRRCRRCRCRPAAAARCRRRRCRPSRRPTACARSGDIAMSGGAVTVTATIAVGFAVEPAALIVTLPAMPDHRRRRRRDRQRRLAVVRRSPRSATATPPGPVGAIAVSVAVLRHARGLGQRHHAPSPSRPAARHHRRRRRDGKSFTETFGLVTMQAVHGVRPLLLHRVAGRSCPAARCRCRRSRRSRSWCRPTPSCRRDRSPPR